MEKVDVIINVYGKPWQTLCTLKTLIKHSGNHIDKIFLIKENEQPYNEDISWIFDYFNNIVVYTPKKYNFIKRNVNLIDNDDRYGVRYQYGIENSDKKYVFITHNDVLYTGDIIGEMLNLIGDSVGVGEIGQCWNCPAKKMNLCSGDKFYEWNPTYNDVLSLPLPHVRTSLQNIDRINPKPMPECRLNEWSCLINREINNKETYPNSNTPLFGMYGIDMGDLWFRSLHLKGYNFIDYRKNFIHSYWSTITSGYQTQLKKELYDKSEENAKKYYEENF
jgi:hypothetical protein